MAQRKKFIMSLAQRQRRSFSDEFKREKVREIETGITKVSEICKQYEVSTTSVYRWIDQFGSNKKKPEILIVEKKSDTKKLLELKQKVAELEQMVGQKQVLLDFKDKMIGLAEEHYGIDIKKKFSTRQSSISGKTGKQ